MNLEDLVDEDGLQQDEWSLNKPVFGKDGQLQVIGHNKSKGNKKCYILKCAICSQDSELFGDGYFKSVKNSLINIGALPCGCAMYPKWDKKQYYILATRRAEEYKYTFLDFTGDWLGAYTLCFVSCDIHGTWSPTINNFINHSTNCPLCSNKPQHECYINWIIDSKNTIVAVKFGITSNSKRRIKQQNVKSVYEIKLFRVYKFPDTMSCKQAERQCKQTLQTGVITKEDVSDGYTETTCHSNLLKIIQIYEENGGVIDLSYGHS